MPVIMPSHYAASHYAGYCNVHFCTSHDIFPVNRFQHRVIMLGIAMWMPTAWRYLMKF